MFTIQRAADTLHRVNPRLYHSRCFYCGVVLTKARTHRHTATDYTKDHVYPLAQGKFLKRYVHEKGGSRLPNVVPCCRRCNYQKSSLASWEWRDVFFAGHAGKFWGEQLVEGDRCVEFLDPNADISTAPAPLFTAVTPAASICCDTTDVAAARNTNE
jgi:hypothetical protein